MKFKKNGAELFIPDGCSEDIALERTTSLCIAAHQDDTEIMAYSAISECWGKPDNWFTSVIVTDGSGSPRNGIYKNMTDDEMKLVRKNEQKKAAVIGQYSGLFQLSYTSSEARQDNPGLISELADIIIRCRPGTVYIHNLADKHDTHVATALKTIAAIRQIRRDKRPPKIFCMECWRSLDWLNDEDKKVFDASGNPGLAQSLLGCFDSQINGGKRYDLAAAGRKLGNATFLRDHNVDDFTSAEYGLDVTELINSDQDPADFISFYIDKFRSDVVNRVLRNCGTLDK